LFRRDADKELIPYNFKARQLALYYFVILIILHRSEGPGTPASTASLVASSFVAGIFEDFLSRDELRYLGPAFAFYALAGGLSALTGYRYAGLESVAEDEYNVISLSLQHLSDRWGSAEGALRSLKAARKTVTRQPQLTGAPACISSDALTFFVDFGPDLCRQWHLLGIKKSSSSRHRDTAPDGVTDNSTAVDTDFSNQQNHLLSTGHGLPTLSHSTMPFDQGNGMLYPESAGLFLGQQDYAWNDLDPVGTWLLGDLGLEGSFGQDG
jgi:hypothetical protein